MIEKHGSERHRGAHGRKPDQARAGTIVIGEPSPEIRSENPRHRINRQQQANLSRRVAQGLEIKREVRREGANEGEIRKIKPG